MAGGPFDGLPAIAGFDHRKSKWFEIRAEQFAVGGDVIHDQDERRGVEDDGIAGGGDGGGGRRGGNGDGAEFEREDAAAAGGIVGHGDRPVHQVGEAAGDGESEPGAAVLGMVLSGGLLEDAEDPGLELVGDSDSGVGDGDGQMA